MLQHKAAGITLVRWHDNSQVTVANNLADSLVLVKTICSIEIKDEDVPQPSIIGGCNKGMGGVNLLDQNLGRYCVKICCKKWYKPFVSFCLNWCCWKFLTVSGGLAITLAFTRPLFSHFWLLVRPKSQSLFSQKRKSGVARSLYRWTRTLAWPKPDQVSLVNYCEVYLHEVTSWSSHVLWSITQNKIHHF